MEKDLCPRCNGACYEPGYFETGVKCSACRGTGYVQIGMTIDDYLRLRRYLKERRKCDNNI